MVQFWESGYSSQPIRNESASAHEETIEDIQGVILL